MTWILGTLATLSSLASVGSLCLSWRARGSRPGWRALGWVLLPASMLLWIIAQPVEFGVAFALLVPALLAWLLIWQQAPQARPARDTKLEQRGFEWPAPKAFGRQVLRFIASVPFAAVVSSLISVTLTDWLPWEPVNRLVTGVLLMPVFWGAASYWVLADPTFWRAVSALLVAGLLAAAYLFLL